MKGKRMVSKTALLLLDLQNEMVSPEGKFGAAGTAAVVQERKVIENATRILGAFRDKGAPVFHIRLGFRGDYADALSVAPRIARLKQNGAAKLGSWGTEFPEPLTPRPDEFVITKACVNPFFDTNLLSLLHNQDVNQVALGGVATNMVVESTARYADDAGFAVTVLEDCCASGNPALHDWFIANSLPLFGRVISSSDLIAEMA